MTDRTSERATLSPLEGGATFPLRHRLTRMLWTVIWALLARWTPVPFNGWRCFLVRLFGGKIAAGAKIYPTVRIWYPANLEMGPHACLAPGVICYCMDRVVLGDYAIVSQGAHLCGGGHDIDNPAFPLVTGPIHIGRRAWIAAEAFVGPGVVVEDGAVLGARGVATKRLLANQVYVGNPAKPIRTRRNGV